QVMLPLVSSRTTPPSFASSWAAATCGVLLLLIGFGTAARTSGQGPAFPARLASYFNSAGVLSAGERQQLLAGQPVTKLLASDASKEVAVLGAVWVDAPMDRYIEAVTDIEAFERGGGFTVTKTISNPPRLEDFAAMKLPDE